MKQSTKHFICSTGQGQHMFNFVTTTLRGMVLSNELKLALTNHDWPKVSMLIRKYPFLASIWIKRDGLFDSFKLTHCLPLHVACVAAAPFSTIEALVQAHPDGVRTKESSYGRLPIHCACKRGRADPKTIATLINAHSAGCLIPDNLGRLPIHYAINNRTDTTIMYMILCAQPDSAKGVDLEGWSPLHVACSVGHRGAIVALLQIYPDAAFFRTTNGLTPAMCLNKIVVNRNEIKEMLRSACQLFDATFVNPLNPRRTSLVLETDSVLV